MSLLLIDSNESRGLVLSAALRELGWRGRLAPTLEAGVNLLHTIPRPVVVVLAWHLSPGEMRDAVCVLVSQPEQIRPEVVVVVGGVREYAEILERDYADCCVLPGWEAKDVVKVLDLEVEA